MRPYAAALLQTRVLQVRDAASAQATIRENIARIDAMLAYGARFSPGGAPRVAVLPEFALTGFALERASAEWVDMAAHIPGWETAALGELAAKHQTYIGGAAFEYDPEWPGRIWNCGFIIDPSGKVILKHRKHMSGGPGGRGRFAITSPGDVYTEYVARYGEEALFPVVDTPIGKLGLLVSYEITSAELMRCLAMRGAEIILHPTGEPWSAGEGWAPLKRARAIDNMVYLISANHGVYVSPNDASQEFSPPDRSRGLSAIYNYEGTATAIVDAPGEAVLTGSIDIDRLRLHRSAPVNSKLAQLRAQLVAPFFARFPGMPNDVWAKEPIQLSTDLRDALNTVLAGLRREGLLAPPLEDA